MMENIKYYSADVNTTLGIARNAAIERSNGEIIAFLDVDDYWEKNKLELQVPLFKKEMVGIVCGNYWIENELNSRKNNKILSKKNLTRGFVVDELLSNYFVGNLTLMIRKEALNKLTGLIDTRYPIIADFDLVVRIALSWEVDYVSDTIATYRRHGGNLTSTDEISYAYQMIEWIESPTNNIYKQYPGYIVCKCKAYYMAVVAYKFIGNYYNAFRYLTKISCSRERVRGVLVVLTPKFILAYFRK